MIRVWKLPKGDDFLPGVSIQELQKRYQAEKKAKPKVRLLCAIHRKEGKSIDAIAEFTNMKRRTVHATLWRFVERGVDAKESVKQSGRPPELSVKQRKKLVRRLEEGPPYNKGGVWTTQEVRDYIRKEFGVLYTQGHVWEILTALGFSLHRPRPRHYKAPSRKEVDDFKKRLACWRNITGDKGS
ncbi:MAG: IS630 family transposase [Thermoplasmatota archaeon]